LVKKICIQKHNTGCYPPPTPVVKSFHLVQGTDKNTKTNPLLSLNDEDIVDDGSNESGIQPTLASKLSEPP
jgi:hypothetical protein